MERQQQQPGSTPLCRANCGFYGSPATDDYCSKCFKDYIKRKQQTTTTNSASSVATATPTSNSSNIMTTMVAPSSPSPANATNLTASAVVGVVVGAVGSGVSGTTGTAAHLPPTVLSPPPSLATTAQPTLATNDAPSSSPTGNIAIVGIVSPTITSTTAINNGSNSPSSSPPPGVLFSATAAVGHGGIGAVADFNCAVGTVVGTMPSAPSCDGFSPSDCGTGVFAVAATASTEQLQHPHSGDEFSSSVLLTEAIGVAAASSSSIGDENNNYTSSSAAGVASPLGPTAFSQATPGAVAVPDAQIIPMMAASNGDGAGATAPTMPPEGLAGQNVLLMTPPPPPLGGNSSSSSSPPSAAAVVVSSSSTQLLQQQQQQSKPKNRCHQCNKRVGLTGFPCRCGGLFCGEHRYSQAHSCTFDYKTMEREGLRKSNPVVVSDKIDRI